MTRFSDEDPNRQLHFGALAERALQRDGPSALGHALTDRESDPLTIARYGLGIEARAPVAHEKTECRLFYFGVDRYQLGT